MSRYFATLALILLAGTSSASDDESGHPWLYSEFTLEVGVFYPDRQVKLSARGRLDLIDQPQDPIDFGSQLKISESDSTFAAEAGWRYGSNWAMRLQYFESTGSNTAVLEEDIGWEDLEFLAGSSVTAGTEFELTRAVWDYSLVRRPDYRFSLSLGFHWLHIRGYIEGAVVEDSGPVTRGETASVDAPLPNIGFAYTRALSPRWGFRTRFDWFSADIDPYDGLFLNAAVGLNYRLTDRLGIGLNYNYVELDVGVDGQNWRGEVETRLDGIYVYLGAVW